MLTAQTDSDENDMAVQAIPKPLIATKPAPRGDIASPHFRFPRRQAYGSQVQIPSAEPVIETVPVGDEELARVEPAPTASSRSNSLAENETANETKRALHSAHGTQRGPHFQLPSVDAFEGWTIQDTIELTETAAIEAAGAAPSPQKTVPDQLAWPPRTAGTSQTPPRLTITNWIQKSRQTTTGFALDRTRIDPPHAHGRGEQNIATGNELASTHRKWAARTYAAKIQTEVARIGVSPDQQTWINAPVATRSDGGFALTVVPDFRWPQIVSELANPQRPFVNSIRLAVDKLLANGQSRLLVAGSHRQQGTTTLTMAIAKMLAGSNKRVMVIDADLNRAGLSATLGISEGGCWVQQVQCFGTISQAMAISRQTGMVIVPLSPAKQRRSLPPFLFDYLGLLIAPVAGQFDAIIVDVGPVSQLLDELSQPVRLANSLAIVQRESSHGQTELRRVTTSLNAFGISQLAAIQNFAQVAS